MKSLNEIRSYYKILSESGIISYKDVAQIEFDETKFLVAVEDVRSRLKVKLRSGICSSYLIIQIARHYCNIGERFANKIEFYHGSTILDTIEQMELGKLKGTAFSKSELLNGLYKQHHSQLSQGASIARNISMGLSEKDIELSRQQTENTIGFLNKIHSDIIGKRKKSGKLTGEWIVFAKIHRVNYYLCLATHQEGEQDGEILFNKLASTFDEFPVLSSFKQRK